MDFCDSGRRPAEAFPPCEFLRDEMEARRWSKAELARRLGCTWRFVSELVSGDQVITPEIASRLAMAFGIDAQTWLNLESAYRRTVPAR